MMASSNNMLRRPANVARTLSDSSNFAEAFDIARKHLDEKLEELSLDERSPSTDDASSPGLLASGSTASPASPLAGPMTPAAGEAYEVADDFAFAFDIDGVLIRGGRPIPEAIEAMRVLNGENEYGVMV